MSGRAVTDNKELIICYQPLQAELLASLSFSGLCWSQEVIASLPLQNEEVNSCSAVAMLPVFGPRSCKPASFYIKR